MTKYKVFISHGSPDTWVAEQLSKNIENLGADTFLDEKNIAKGDDFVDKVFKELGLCDELLALFTPWSAGRAWVWIEIGAALAKGKRVVGLLHGLNISELKTIAGGIGALHHRDLGELNDADTYFQELAIRISKKLK